MHLYHIDRFHPKGWFTGPWDSSLEISVGYANCAIDAPHRHTRITEIYLVARGFADVLLDGEKFQLESGDVLVVEPGEAHTFLSSSPDYFHFVVHSPGLAGDEALQEKESLSHEDLA